MKINITKKEYRLLLDIFEISSWVMNSHKFENDPDAAPYEILEQKFLSFAKDFGCEHLVEYDKKSGTYYPNSELEESESNFKFISEFEADTFWETLCSELSKRDLIHEKGLSKLEKMETIDRLTAQDKIAEKYRKEFEENGIRNLIISD